MFLSQNKIKFKFRICSDCADDDQTQENIRENAAESIESVARVAKAVGRAAGSAARRKASRPENGDLAMAVAMPNTELLRQALGMEDGEELSFEFGQAVDTAFVATPADPFEEVDFSAEAEDELPWWEDTFFDGSYGTQRGGLLSDEPDQLLSEMSFSERSSSIGSMMGSGMDRFTSASGKLIVWAPIQCARVVRRLLVVLNGVAPDLVGRLGGPW